MRKADAILCADLHLRDTRPICRTDNYLTAQENKIKFIYELRKKHNNCFLFIAGDIFHKAQSSQYLESLVLQYLNKSDVIPGNHDLLNHNINQLYHSSFGVISNSMYKHSNIKLGDYKTLMCGFRTKGGNKIIGMIHQYVYKDKPLHENIKSTKAKKLLKENDFDLIVTGDNHETFVEEYQGRILVNPGSMMRMTADQINHKPCVFLYYADENKVEPVYFPIQENIISRKHIDEKQILDDVNERLRELIWKAVQKN
jgi:DNA repair exonuclease SbcCD nuclease subunit